MQLIVTHFLILFGICSALQAMEGTKQWPETSIGYINFQFEKSDGEAVKTARQVMVPSVNGASSDQIYTTHDGMRKTMLAINMGSAIKKALKSFEACDGSKEQQEAVKNTLLQETLALEAEALKLSKAATLDEGFLETAKLMKNLANNIGSYERYSRQSMGRAECCREKCAAPLSVTAGGAKDVGHFRAVVERGNVPKSSDFTMEGFLSEFALGLEGQNTSEYLSMEPASLFDAGNKKLYVQLGMSTSQTEATFKRKPLNLVIVLDISGSMDSEDGTGKSRLEWSKDMISQAVENMNEADKLGIVLFDDQVETLLESQNVTNSQAIKDLYTGLNPRQSTDLFAGLKRGYEIASKQANKTFENRVILISDAGWNTGRTNNSELQRLISDYAGESIGLTAIGIGENFEEDLIHEVTTSKGGNYIFVQSGKEMGDFFKQFKFLVTPVAYNFKATLDLDPKQVKIANAYGIPMNEGEPLSEVINVRTLFFTGKGGGAMVLELDWLK